MSRVQKFFVKKSLSQQNFRDSCNVNKIIKRYSQTHGVDLMRGDPNLIGGVFGDFSSVPDLRVALERVKRAEAIFEALPLNVRHEFNHDVARFADYAFDPANRSRLCELGLIPKDPPVQDAVNQASFSPTVNEEKKS